MTPVSSLTLGTRLRNCDFNYDGFTVAPAGLAVIYNGVAYPLSEQKRDTWPAYRHAVSLDASKLFLQPLEEMMGSGAVAPDVTLDDNSRATGAGEKLTGFEGQAAGSAPDLGALQHGTHPPAWGPRKTSTTEPAQ